MLYHVSLEGRTFRVELDGERTCVDGVDIGAVSLAHLPGTPTRHLLANGAATRIIAHDREDGWSMLVHGWTVHATVVDERTHAVRALTAQSAAPQGPRPVRAPMPGMIVRVEVGPGDSVDAGAGIVVMEAMKMENELKAESAGRVSRVLVQAGQAVEKNAILVEFEAADV